MKRQLIQLGCPTVGRRSDLYRNDRHCLGLGSGSTRRPRESIVDFNGDRIADFAVGVPSEDQTGADEGAVNVIYGSATGLNQAGNQVWDQDSAGIGGVREAGARIRPGRLFP